MLTTATTTAQVTRQPHAIPVRRTAPPITAEELGALVLDLGVVTELAPGAGSLWLIFPTPEARAQAYWQLAGRWLPTGALAGRRTGVELGERHALLNYAMLWLDRAGYGLHLSAACEWAGETVSVQL